MEALESGTAADVLGLAAAERAERLAALRHQRTLLRDLRDRLDSVARLAASLGRATGWRSPAQGRYAERRDDLLRDLSRAERQLGIALAAVEQAITTTTEED